MLLTLRLASPLAMSACIDALDADLADYAMCSACGNIHPRQNHAACAANVAAGLHADGLNPETDE